MYDLFVRATNEEKPRRPFTCTSFISSIPPSCLGRFGVLITATMNFFSFFRRHGRVGMLNQVQRRDAFMIWIYYKGMDTRLRMDGCTGGKWKGRKAGIFALILPTVECSISWRTRVTCYFFHNSSLPKSLQLLPSPNTFSPFSYLRAERIRSNANKPSSHRVIPPPNHKILPFSLYVFMDGCSWLYVFLSYHQSKGM